MPAWYVRAWLAVWCAPGRVWAGMMAAGPLSLWLTAGAAMAWTVVSAGLVWLFKDRIAASDAVTLVLAADVIVGLAVLAITGREIGLSLSRSGLQVDIGKDDHDDELPPSERVQR